MDITLKVVATFKANGKYVNELFALTESGQCISMKSLATGDPGPLKFEVDDYKSGWSFHLNGCDGGTTMLPLKEFAVFAHRFGMSEFTVL